MNFKTLFILGTLVGVISQGYASNNNGEEKKRTWSVAFTPILRKSDEKILPDLQNKHGQLYPKASLLFDVAKSHVILPPHDPENFFIKVINTLEKLGFPVDETEIQKTLEHTTDEKKRTFLASRYFKKGNVVKAIEIYTDLLEHNHISNHHITSYLEAYRNDKDSILLKLKQVVHYLPYRKALIKLYIEAEEIEKAENSYQILLKLFAILDEYQDEYREWQLYYAKFMYQVRYKIEEAKFLYKKCAGNDPKSKNWLLAHKELMLLYSYQGDYENAEKEFYNSVLGLETLSARELLGLKKIYNQWLIKNPCQPAWRQQLNMLLFQGSSSPEIIDLIKSNIGPLENCKNYVDFAENPGLQSSSPQGKQP